MSDLISRQAAIDVARKCPVKEVTPAYMLIDKSEMMMIKIIAICILSIMLGILIGMHI